MLQAWLVLGVEGPALCLTPEREMWAEEGLLVPSFLPSLCSGQACVGLGLPLCWCRPSLVTSGDT